MSDPMWRKMKLDYLKAAYESLIGPLKALGQATKSRLIEELETVLDGGREPVDFDNDSDSGSSSDSE